MNLDNIIVKWNKSIIELLESTQVFLNSQGVSDILSNESISLFKNELISFNLEDQDKDITYKTINNLEFIGESLISINKQIFTPQNIQMIYQYNQYNNTEIIENYNKYKTILGEILEKSLETSLVNGIEGYDHGSIITKLHIKLLIKKNSTNELEIYKNKILNDSKTTTSSISILRINYLLMPFNMHQPNNNIKKPTMTINLSSQVINMNIEPLFIKSKALEFGPLHTMKQGIDIPLINRFKTFISSRITKKITPEKNNIITDKVILFNGQYNIGQPLINWDKTREWNPNLGVSSRVYNYNDILSKKILQNMNVLHEHYNFDKKKYKKVNNNILQDITISQDLYDFVFAKCFKELDELLKESNVEEYIKREAYVSQFFNAQDIVSKIKSKQMEDIEIVPITFMFSFFNII